MNKVVPSVEEAISGIEDGAVIAIPGFFAAGVPRVLLKAIIAKGVENLTLTCGCGPLLGASDELEALVKNGQIISRVIPPAKHSVPSGTERLSLSCLSPSQLHLFSERRGTHRLTVLN